LITRQPLFESFKLWPVGGQADTKYADFRAGSDSSLRGHIEKISLLASTLADHQR
jgi:hypothetical protein